MEWPSCVQNSGKVVKALGFWPGFHDAEVISVSASRSGVGNPTSSSARLCVNVRYYKEIGQGTADYEVVCFQNLLIEFLFDDLRFFSVEDFNHQNVIDAIEFLRVDDQLIEVNIRSIFGFGGVIRCARVEVGEVTTLI
ncbi:immunity 50 family protein [Pseudomonas sp. p1(2021b)]|uniref:Imm50 family immunity protein n=1 Tax=Pseudomonas sp. p1(2021b) TaxID=2874628 RepID=UPI001CCB5A02|nr:Imm50 family immunity protein [Pseudomonas sp. p1(2021b)]UBM27039.1 immunity 50 family protein [Pseudomonas sp. p1(2021b)]